MESRPEAARLSAKGLNADGCRLARIYPGFFGVQSLTIGEAGDDACFTISILFMTWEIAGARRSPGLALFWKVTGSDG
jgi:hypothetical protein